MEAVKNVQVVTTDRGLALLNGDGSITVVEIVAQIPAFKAVESSAKEVAKAPVREPVKESGKTVAPAKTPEKETETVTDDEWTEEEIDALDRDALIEVIEDEELDIDPDEFKSTVKLRKAVKEELGLDD